MPTFNNLKDLFKHINNQITDTLQNEVSEKVKDVQSDKVREVVYGGYTSQKPKYDRRNGNGGLADKSNMKSTVTSSGNDSTLEVKNVADSNPNVDYTAGTNAPNYLAGIIEYGRDSGLYSYNRTGTESEFMSPRPFTEETVDELERTEGHVDAMKTGLKKRGIDVE